MSWLHNTHPIVINAELAEQVGLNEAIILQQLNYWLSSTGSGVDHDGARWIYNTFDQWQKQFPFWSLPTIKRSFESLKNKQLILVKQLSKSKHDRTNYYSINHALLDKKLAETRAAAHCINLIPSNGSNCADRVDQTDTVDGVIVNPSTGSKRSALTETTTETTPEITTDTLADGASASIGDKKKAVEPKGPMVIESGDKRIEIPAELRYPGADTKSHKTWINYAVCYHKRYGAWPVWNRSIGGMVSKLLERVGIEAAPKVAAFYVGVNEGSIVNSGHSFKMLLSGAEKYHMQWQTGRQMTSTRARQIDQTQSNHDAADEAMQMLAIRRAENANA